MATPSQVSKAKGCARKLALGLFVPYEQSESAKLGDEVHACSEAYQKCGQQPDENTIAGRVFLPALAWSPNPLTCTPETQVKWRFGGVTWVLRPDLHGLTKHLPKAPPGAPAVFVLDYKSSRDPKAYGLWDKQSFLADEEAIIYALWAMSAYGETSVLLRWLYLQTPEKNGKHKPKASTSDVIVTLSEVCDAYDRNVRPYVPIVDGVYREKWAGRLTTETALALLPNPNHCNAFGGCPFRSTCNLSSLDALKEDTYHMDLLAEMQKLTPAAVPAAPSLPASPPVPAPSVNAIALPIALPIAPQPAAAPVPVFNSAAFTQPPPAPVVPVVFSTPDGAGTSTPIAPTEPYSPHIRPSETDGAMPSNAELGAAVRVLFRALLGGGR